jgi:DNA helicase HerA-like ATPase
MTQPAPRPAAATVEPVGRVSSISGAQASIALTVARGLTENAQTKIGKFLGIVTGKSVVIGVVTEIAETPPGQGATARVDLVGELRQGNTSFQRGVTDYPSIGDAAIMLGDRELRPVYGAADADTIHIGQLQQDNSIAVNIDVDDLLSKHFAILGTTGVGKSSGVAVVLQQILQKRPNLRIFLVDPHNEYGQCFGPKAQVLTPKNLRLPFWLFNFEEIIDAFFGGRPGIDEEVEILADVIPQAKGAYLQYRNSAPGSALMKKKDAKTTGFTADTPVPYRIEDLINILDQRMGKLENRTSRTIYHKLIGRIQTFRNHPRYAFMFENANIGGDTMAEVLAQLFRLAPDGKSMTVMQMAGFPAEVVDSVVSVVCRMAFDFGLWSDGVSPLLFVCEEAHRYAPANSKIGFGPTRRALSRIAKEGRKYGVFLGLVTQRPAEIDPTIISQCNTLFVMRMSNDRDQSLIRSAVSDAAANLLTFIPSLGTREVFAFGSAVTVPTRLIFSELPVGLRPNSEASGNTSTIAAGVDKGLIESVIERWRGSTMSHRGGYDDDFGANEPTFPVREEAAPLQPSQGGLDANRFRTLRKPLDAGPGQTAAANPDTPLPPGYAPLPSRYR